MFLLMLNGNQLPTVHVVTNNIHILAFTYYQSWIKVSGDHRHKYNCRPQYSKKPEDFLGPSYTLNLKIKFHYVDNVT